MIKFRTFQNSDVKSLALHGNNENVSRFLREVFPYPYTEEAATWWVSKGCYLENTFNLAITLNDECIGSAGLQFQENEHRFSCELGFWLGEKYWGQGIAKKAVEKLKEIAFNEHGVKRLYGTVVSDNIASMKVLESCGFTLEGVLKNNQFLRGRFYDEYIYAVHS